MPEKLGTVPIIIGVTGHRDPDPQHLGALDAAIEGIFDDLATTCPRTPVVLLSGLAEGADRRVAEIALRREACLVACLPLPSREYERDFSGERSRADFRNLLEQSSCAIEVPLTDEAAVAVHGRAAHYVALGAFLARHSQILIALWDGRDSGKLGGTSDVVRSMRAGATSRVAPGASRIGIARGRPVFHVMTPRASDPGCERGEDLAAGRLRILPPDGIGADEGQAVHRTNLRKMEQFNRDAVLNAARLRRVEKRRRERHPGEADIVGGCGSPRGLVARQHTADGLSSLFQRRVLWHSRLVLVAALLAIASFVAAAISSLPPTVLASLVGVLGAACCATWSARHLGWRRKCVDYRVLADCVGAEIAWRLAGLDGCATDRLKPARASELGWIRDGLAAWNLIDLVERQGDNGVSEASAPSEPKLEVVLNAWIRQECASSRRRARANQRALRRCRRLFAASVAVGFLCAAVTLGWTVREGCLATQHSEVVTSLGGSSGVHPLTAGAIVGFVTAALISAFSKARAFGTEARHFEALGVTFASAERALTAALGSDDLVRAVAIVEDLATETLDMHASRLGGKALGLAATVRFAPK